MGVAEDDGIKVGWVEAEVAVHGVCLFAQSLEHAAVEQNFSAIVEGDEVFGSGNGAGGAMETYLHLFGVFKVEKLIG